MAKSSVIRMWITEKKSREITPEMIESMMAFLSVAAKYGCLGSTFAEDDERVIVYTRWSDEMALEQFRSSNVYQIQEGKIIQSFAAAGFEIPDDILFNSTGKIVVSNEFSFFPNQKDNQGSTKINPITAVALGYVPLVIFLMVIASMGSSNFAGYYLFIYSGMGLMILFPIYTIYLAFLTWHLHKNGALTPTVSTVHILSFIIPLLYLLMFVTFSGSVA